MNKKNCPILIFKGDEELCYGILRFFSEELEKALISVGEDVVFFDPKRDVIGECFGKEFKAIIGFMETFFYNYIPGTDTRVFDLIKGPKFNYWPDHPAFYYQFVNDFPNDYHILTLDRNYVKYINRFYKNVDAFFLPPGACEPGELIPFSERQFDLTFLGTYVDYREVLDTYNSADEVTSVISRTYLDYLVKYPNLTTEEAFAQTLYYLEADISTEQFLSALQKTHRIATMGAARYYKEKVIQTIVDSGITVDVFGDSWRKSPFAESKYLIIHDSVHPENAIDIYRDSKISLNIMTWHKDSITERVLDSMISGSIALTDETPVLSEVFLENEDILFFSLDKIDKVPDIIKRHMNDGNIAMSGCMKVREEHCWKDRAKELLKIIDSI